MAGGMRTDRHDLQPSAVSPSKSTNGTHATGREPEAMKSLIAPLAGLAVLVAGAGAALAAPPAYCALYAREYANQFTEAAGEQPGAEPKIQDEAYYRCLNMDQEPEMPKTSAYYGTSVDTAGQGGPLVPVTSSAAAPAGQSAGPATGQATGSGAGQRRPRGQTAPAPANNADTATFVPAAPAKPADIGNEDGRHHAIDALLHRRQEALDARMVRRLQEVLPQFLQREGRHHPAPRRQQAGVLPIGARRQCGASPRPPFMPAAERASRREVPRGRV